MVLPNQLTTLRIILTPIFFFLFISDDPFLKQIALIIYFIAAITDWYDGWLARKFNYITNWGKFMDPLADKFLTSAAFIAFVILGFVPLWMVIIIIVRDFYVTGLRIYADIQNKAFTTSKLAKVKTFTQMIFVFYLLIVITLKTIQPLAVNYNHLLNMLTDHYFVYYTMLIITLFTFYTGITYTRNNLTLIKELFSFETK